MTRDEAIAAGMAAYWDCEHESEAEARDAFLASLAASGFAVVPVEATCEMVNAAPSRPQPREDETMYSSIWRAMISAAQEDGK